MLAALGALLAVWWMYGRAYPLEADGSGFAQAAEEYLSRGSGGPAPYAVEPRQTLDLGRKRFVLAELNDGTDLSLGLFYLEQGLNGRYQIAWCSWGSSSFRRRVVRDEDRAYYLLGGRNSLLGLSSASFSLKDEDLGRETYRLEIPAEDYFLTMTEINPGFSTDYEEPGSLRFYDGAGREITDRLNV